MRRFKGLWIMRLTENENKTMITMEMTDKTMYQTFNVRSWPVSSFWFKFGIQREAQRTDAAEGDQIILLPVPHGKLRTRLVGRSGGDSFLDRLDHLVLRLERYQVAEQIVHQEALPNRRIDRRAAQRFLELGNGQLEIGDDGAVVRGCEEEQLAPPSSSGREGAARCTRQRCRIRRSAPA